VPIFWKFLEIFQLKIPVKNEIQLQSSNQINYNWKNKNCLILFPAKLNFFNKKEEGLSSRLGYGKFYLVTFESPG